ncbi:MAG: arylsulfatase [Lentisphaeraceae bacterium]|nr:arylsulfatase [Lentisphaeraceae bacterium]
MKLLCVLLVYLLSFSSLAADKPNIIVIYTDDQGYGDCSLLNPQSKFKTPAIDRIGSEGIIFTDGHCSNTVCSPSRYGLLTGRYSWRTYLKKGVIGSDGKPMIANNRSTLASLMKRNGYNTAMVGKWHLGMKFNDDGSKILDGPLQKGFDYFWGIPASMNYGYCAWYDMGFAKVAPSLWTTKKRNKMAIDDYRIIPPYDTLPPQKLPIKVAEDFEDIKVLERFTNKAVQWIDKVHKDDKPFFLYLPLTSPHKPVVPQERFRGKSQAGAYGDFMIETNFWIGQVIKALEDRGIYENTMIIFSSDNGPENTYPKRMKLHKHDSNHMLRGGKRDIYDGGHRVPFFISWPKGIKGGQKYEQPVNQLDLFATLADLLGDKLGKNEAEDSVSFASVFRSKAPSKRLPMIHQSSSGQYAIREGEWKYIAGGKLRGKVIKPELYNLTSDIGESKNVLGQYPEIAKGLKEKLTMIISSGKTRTECTTQNDAPVTISWE